MQPDATLPHRPQLTQTFFCQERPRPNDIASVEVNVSDQQAPLSLHTRARCLREMVTLRHAVSQAGYFVLPCSKSSYEQCRAAQRHLHGSSPQTKQRCRAGNKMASSSAHIPCATQNQSPNHETKNSLQAPRPARDVERGGSARRQESTDGRHPCSSKPSEINQAIAGPMKAHKHTRNNRRPEQRRHSARAFLPVRALHS